MPTPLGLKVCFPGFRISVTKYKDGKPRHPWPGLKRIPEAYVHFRDAETGEWYMVSDKKYAYLSSKWRTEEERQEYNKLELFPLHDVADTDKALVITRGGGKEKGSNLRDGVYAFPVPRDEMDVVGEDGMAVRTERHIIVNSLDPDNGYIYTAIGRLAMELRADEMTDKHLDLYEKLKHEVGNSPEALKANMQESEEFKASMKGLRERMKVMTADLMKEDGRLVKAVKDHFGESFLEDIWVLIQDWFNHDYTADKVADDQIWYVD
jgi:hypothetical protein